MGIYEWFTGAMIAFLFMIFGGSFFLLYHAMKNDQELKLFCLERQMAYIDNRCVSVSISQ